ncbi:lanthionine synthetase C family protein [Actinomadura atramentaria]|uniref:lanthionine synthetase C family protein n=1 Tax=Actinomadura atramentaria TaxID=1990 RepID=UPI00037D8711|nr:lanthionine synthetase C family protein [Actinomadura atramentaria]
MTSVDPPKAQALSEGALGVALLHIERGDHTAAKRLLAMAVTDGVSVGANASLFHGAPALEFVLRCAQRTDLTLQNAVDRVVAARLAAALRRREAGRLPHLAEFDLIRGLTGLGALLLSRPSRSGLIEEVLTALVSLARPVESDGRLLPGWWSADGPGHEPIVGGHSNNGMAHGIAGPLALLSLATGQGVEVEGQLAAIDRFAGWLDRYGASYWTTRDQITDGEPAPSIPLRPSWCYGALGVVRALQLAAIALDDSARRQAAEDRALAALTDTGHLNLITDVSLCHGWAGVLTVTRSIAADSRTPHRFAAHIEYLRRRVDSEIGALTKPGFLEGRAGARLALDGTDATGWTRALLIA